MANSLRDFLKEFILAGAHLKKHFPHKKDDVNELPDEISFDKLKGEQVEMIKKIFYLFITGSFIIWKFSGVIAFSQDIPERPVPPRLVNDFAGMLNRDEVNSLEQKLVAFNDSTSTQIAIVIVPTLMGYDQGGLCPATG